MVSQVIVEMHVQKFEGTPKMKIVLPELMPGGSHMIDVLLARPAECEGPVANGEMQLQIEEQ